MMMTIITRMTLMMMMMTMGTMMRVMMMRVMMMRVMMMRVMQSLDAGQAASQGPGRAEASPQMWSQH